MRPSCAAALLVLAAAPAAAQYPTTPPSPGPLRPFQLPAFQEATLPNGLRLVVIENHELPVLSVSLSVEAGSKRDPAGREGTATLLAELLTRGTTTRTAAQLGSQFEAVGGSMAAEADLDFITLMAGGLSESARLFFDAMGEVVQGAAFPATEFNVAKQRLQASVDQTKTDPQAIADRTFARAIYGDHPYGRRPTAGSVQLITRDEIARHATTWLKPGAALLVVAGDISLAQAREHAQRAFGNWRGAAPAVPTTTPPSTGSTRIRLVNRAGAVQSAMVMGNLGLSATDPRQYALIVGNRILGGGNDSRLVQEMRDAKRWTPDAHSEIGRQRELGHFLVAAQVRQQVTNEALTAMGDQLERFRTEAVADSELVRAKNYLLGSFPRQAETPRQVAAQVATAKLMGWGDDYVRSFRERIAAVTAQDVLAAAKAATHPDSALVVLVGDGQKLHEAAKMLGPVDLVDIDGKMLAVEDLTPKPGPLTLDKSQLVSRRDSFVVIVNGSPLGTFVAETAVRGDSIDYHELLAIPVARWSLDTRAILSLSTLEMRKLDQTGSMSNQPAETHLLFGGGRVRGRAQIPQPGGTPKITQIDTTVAQGVIDVGAVSLVVPGLPLEPQTSYTIFVFDAASGTVKPVQVTVLAVGNLGVPAGVFPVFQVQVMGPQPLILYITRDAPRRVVKIERMGQPMSFELVK